MTPSRKAWLLAAALLASLPARAAAQFGSFGTNKIQYRQFHWQVLHGPHVDLHFYPEEEALARSALAYAEATYDSLEGRFREPVGRRIPLIIYASHTDFEQTNVLPFVPPEELLGVTEFLKRRVAIPFRGNYAEFRHTIRHEMVHVFQLAKLELNADVYFSPRHVEFPLWWQEGLAEYFSAGEDTRDEMILRDLTQRGNLPTMGQLTYASGGIVYPLGGILLRFLGTTYGDWRIVQMYDDAWKYDSFDELLATVYGKTAEQLSAEWQYWMRRRYYPGVGEQRPLELDARRVARLAIKPAVWLPPGDTEPQVLYLSPRTGYTNVYATPLTGGPTRTLVEGERTAEFESFHAFDSRLDVSDSGVAVFTSKFQDRDALFFWSIREGKVVGRYEFPEIVSILSPSWSPGDSEVVFSGLSLSGFSDLYVLKIRSGRLERLTSDRFQDLDPSFSPDGTRIVFSSDRTPFGRTGALNLFVLDRATGRTRYLTYGKWNDEGPRWSSDGRITFTSDRRGIYDVYWVDSTGAGQRETGVPGGVFDAEWIPSQHRYVFGGFENLSFNIYSLAATLDSAPPEGRVALAPDTLASGWEWGDGDAAAALPAPLTTYHRQYSVDFAAGDAVYAPGYFSAQGLAFLASDMLGDNLFYASAVFAQQGSSLSSILSSINATAMYINQTRRLNWGAGAFRRRGLFFDGDFDATYEESTFGGFALLRYPLSRFDRLEGTFQLERSDRTDYYYSTPVPFGADLPHRVGVLASNYFSYVHDNSLWLETGPIDGARTNITGGVVTDFQNARLDSWLVAADLRRYFRASLRTALAVRLYGYYAGGERPRRVSMGGSNAIRGYPIFSYVSGTQVLMANAEWRFPITNYLSIGFPVGEFRFPGIQGALFFDAGRVWSYTTTDRGIIGSYGLGLRMSMGGPLVLRTDIGWRYGQKAENGYSLPLNDRGKSFVALWFGFNY